MTGSKGENATSFGSMTLASLPAERIEESFSFYRVLLSILWKSWLRGNNIIVSIK
jgi:hypothetical protein